MADVIIKPAAGGNLVLQEDGGTAAVTIDTSGDVQLSGSMTAGTLGSAVVVPQATTKKIHRFVFRRYMVASSGSQEYFTWGHFKPLDPVNNSFWLEGFLPCKSGGQDFSGFGVRFTKHGGGTADVDYFNKGHWYTDPNQPTSAMTMQNYCFNVAAGVLSAGTWDIRHVTSTGSSNPGAFCPNAGGGSIGDMADTGTISGVDARYQTPTEGHLVIYEYKNNL